MAFKIKLAVIVIAFCVLENSQGTLPNAAYCAAHPTHTWCLPPPACTPSNRGIITTPSPLQIEIVRIHNVYRSLVATGIEYRGNPGLQPAAAAPTAANPNNLGILVWNDELAQVAQRWADQCKFASDPLRDIVLGTGTTVDYVGQNVYGYVDYAYAVPSFTDKYQLDIWREAIGKWYNEVPNFPKNVVTKFAYNATYGKYTQLVWGITTDVGCGMTQWTLSNNRVARILVCNYGPGGNRVGLPVYVAA